MENISSLKKRRNKKILYPKKSKDETFIQNGDNSNSKSNNSLNKNSFSKGTKDYNKKAFDDLLKTKILKSIKRSKSRQNIFKNKYLYFGKKENNEKTNDLLKSTIEMESKFNDKKREGLKYRYELDHLLRKVFIKPISRISKSIIINYKPLVDNKNDMSFESDMGKNSFDKTMKKSYSNKDFYTNNRKIKRKSFFIGTKQKKSIFSYRNKKISFVNQNLPFFNYYRNKNNNSIKCNISNVNHFNNEKRLFNLEKIVKNNTSAINHLIKLKAKKNSKLLSDSIQNFGENTVEYEMINPKSATNKKNRNSLINKSNLTRLIKVENVLKNGYYEDDDINSINELKKFKIDYGRTLKLGYLPKSVKTKDFLKSTMFKFNQYFGKYFGVPV